MRALLKFVSIALAAALFGAGMALPSSAQYQGPNGHYDSQSDFSRSDSGIPCGISCTQRAKQRWAHRHHHSHSQASYNNH
jgi:hypothetical protein